MEPWSQMGPRAGAAPSAATAVLGEARVRVARSEPAAPRVSAAAGEMPPAARRARAAVPGQQAAAWADRVKSRPRAQAEPPRDRAELQWAGEVAAAERQAQGEPTPAVERLAREERARPAE